MKKRAGKYVIGIDEVGRGALAGPVVVAAVCFPAGMRISNRKLGAMKDSKKLSPKLRELWKEHFKSIPEMRCAVARVYPRVIERINISQAANRAAGLAAGRLMKSLWQDVAHRPTRHSNILQNVGMFRIFLDGGLYLKNKKNQSTLRLDSGRMIVKTIIRADEKITSVKVASIVAKVQRDKYMEKLSKKHPQYGFEIHRGYGTRAHMSAIRKFGPSEAHRKTFIRFS